MKKINLRITFPTKLLILVVLFINFKANGENNETNFLKFKKLNTKVETTVFEGNVISPEGAWCWFADSRALHYQNSSNTINSTYIGYIDVHGNIKATQQDFITGKNNEVLIRSYFQPDDHDNPSFLVLPDERIMIFYSRHTDEACFYFRISKKPGDITSLGSEIKLVTTNNTTYPSPFILTDDPTHIYLCWRGINWHPTIGRLKIPDTNDQTDFDWGPFQMIQSTAARPYCKYESNGKDRIYLSYTLGHPDNENPNWLYFNYVDINTKQLKDVTGNVLSTIASGVHNINATSTYLSNYPNAVVDNPSLRDWVWQTAMDKDGQPVIAMVQINADKSVHNYYYAKWTGSAWRKTFLANGGGKFHQTAGLELCYSGGMAIDDSQPNIVYCSVPVTGTSGNIYEIIKYTIGTDGSIVSSEQITSNSTLNNVRPFIVKNSDSSPLSLIWMHGNYYDWIVSSSRPQGYPTAIHSKYLLPADLINLNNGLIVNENFNGSISGTANTSKGVLVTTKESNAVFSMQNSTDFSISLTPYIYEGAYEGKIFEIGNLSYGLDGNTLKPFLKIGSEVYTSTNLLGNSDVWQTQSRGTGGVWWEPTKIKFFNLTMTYSNGIFTIYRNGLIDQVITNSNLLINDLVLGGFVGWIEDCKIYNRVLTQGEVKKLTEASLTYTFDTSLLTGIDLETIKIPANIYTDVVLPVKTLTGSSISWTSSNTSIISNSGIGTFPQSSTQLTLTATINGQSKVFNVTSYPRNIENNKLVICTFNSEDLFDNNGTKFIKDKSGKSNDLAIYGNANIDNKLNLTSNTAAGFSSNGYAMATNGLLNNLRSYTFLVKVNPSNLNSQPRIFDFGSASTNSLLLRASAFTAGFKYNGGTTTLINSTASLPIGQESKVALSFDAKTKVTKIYLNGLETASSSTIAYEPYQLTTIGTNNRNYIGRTQWWDTSVASSNIDFNGTIDDFYLFDIALTPAEINFVQSDSYSGLKKTEQLSYSLFPNPASKNSNVELNLSTTDDVIFSNIEVFNSLGKLIKSIKCNSKSVDLGSFNNSGLFLVKMSSNRNVSSIYKLLIL